MKQCTARSSHSATLHNASCCICSCCLLNDMAKICCRLVTAKYAQWNELYCCIFTT